MQKTLGYSPSLRMLARALFAYLLSAFVLLVLASFLLSRTNAGSDVLGYVCSGISFLSAFLSGRVLAHSQKDLSFYAAFLFAVLLIILLLTFGFLAGERSLDPSGVLSVVSFTFAGVLLAALLPLCSLPRKSRRLRVFRG